MLVPPGAYSGWVDLGLLSIDSLDEPHRSVGGDYPERFGRLFAAAGAELTVHDGRSDKLPDPDRHQGWIIPGSRQSTYDDLAWIARLEDWIRVAHGRRTPLLGICFGHQLVAQALGGRVAKADGGWNIGAVAYDVCGAVPGVDLPPRFRLLASHQDQVVELPAGATVVARAGTCPVAAYVVADSVLCVQGHPEFDPELARSLYSSRVERIGAEPVAAALDTLDGGHDGGVVARWMVDFVARFQPGRSTT